MLKRKTSQTIEFDDLPQLGGKGPEWSSTGLPPLNHTQKGRGLMEQPYILPTEQLHNRKTAEGRVGQINSQDTQVNPASSCTTHIGQDAICLMHAQIMDDLLRIRGMQVGGNTVETE